MKRMIAASIAAVLIVLPFTAAGIPVQAVAEAVTGAEAEVYAGMAAGTPTQAATDSVSEVPAGAAAVKEGPLSYDRAVALMRLNSVTLKKLERSESNALRQYRSNAENAKDIDVNGTTVKFGDQEVYIHFDPETKLAMTKVKELYPEQMKFSWEAARDNRVITANNLNTALRGVFFGVYSAQAELRLKQKQLALAADINKQDRLKLENGTISPIDLQESDYNLLRAQKGADAAKRNYENAVRSFNQFVGLPSGTRFTEIIYEDVLNQIEWKPVDYYIREALANRLDIVSIRKQIALNELNKRIIKSFYIYKVSSSDHDEYERLLNDLEQLGLDLESMELSIINEIKNAYVDVINTGRNVDNMNNSLKLQRSRYADMQARYEAGMISKNTLTQAELGLIQLENGYRAALFDYNTKIIRFNNAAGIGPGY